MLFFLQCFIEIKFRQPVSLYECPHFSLYVNICTKYCGGAALVLAIFISAKTITLCDIINSLINYIFHLNIFT
jgi:hypothetical protein